jgi:hypothetical protein
MKSKPISDTQQDANNKDNLNSIGLYKENDMYVPLRGSLKRK